MEYLFTYRYHWWFNAGLSGLYMIANKDALREQRIYHGIKMITDSSGLIFTANSTEDLRQFLSDCHEHIAGLYWNISNKNQKEKEELVIYNQETDELRLTSKRNPIPPIHKVIGARSWKAEGENYRDLDQEIQKRVDTFLKETGKTLWGKDQKLLFSPPVCHEKDIVILPEPKKNKKTKTCCICGMDSTHTMEISQPIYLLFASKSAAQSFHSQGQKPDLVCWECNLISKFAYECIHYKVDNDRTMIISPNSSEFQHLISMQGKLGSHSALRLLDDEYFMKNIGLNKNELLFYAKKPYELLWAFFYDAYQLLKDEMEKQEMANQHEMIPFFVEDILSAPTEIIMMTLLNKGQTFLTQDFIIYQDTGYIFRLFLTLEEKEIDLRTIFNDLYDPNQVKVENRTLFRNTVLRRILQKNAILKQIEQFCFTKIINYNGWMQIRNMTRFVREYQLLLKEDSMTKEQISVAVNLGKQIVLQAREKLGVEAMKKVKGDLYKLRKTRTSTDFLNQLNTLQFRYGISVSHVIQEGIIHEVPFEDFRAYCMLGALNVYNAITKNKEGEMNNEES